MSDIRFSYLRASPAIIINEDATPPNNNVGGQGAFSPSHINGAPPLPPPGHPRRVPSSQFLMYDSKMPHSLMPFPMSKRSKSASPAVFPVMSSVAATSAVKLSSPKSPPPLPASQPPSILPSAISNILPLSQQQRTSPDGSGGCSSGHSSVQKSSIGGGSRRAASRNSKRRRGVSEHRKDPTAEYSSSAINYYDDMKIGMEKLSIHGKEISILNGNIKYPSRFARQNGQNQGTAGGYSTSTYSSTVSSTTTSESTPGGVRRSLIRGSSLETINTNITSAGDEFVWLDSHSRLVELQHLPYTNQDVLRLLQEGRVKSFLGRLSMEIVPRLSFLLQRPLVRVAREAQRLSRSYALICSKHEIAAAIKVIMCTSLADSCIKAGHRAAAIFTVSGPENFRQSKSTRAGLQFSVGRFHRWMSDVNLGLFVHEVAAIYLTAAMENLLEEITLQCLSAHALATGNPESILTNASLEECIANNPDFWGLLQPYAHLNSGRTATGALALSNFFKEKCFLYGSQENAPSSPSTASSSSSSANSNHSSAASYPSSTDNNHAVVDSQHSVHMLLKAEQRGSKTSLPTGSGSNGVHDSRINLANAGQQSVGGSNGHLPSFNDQPTLEPTLLTTCVGSAEELVSTLNHVLQFYNRIVYTNESSNGGSMGVVSSSTSVNSALLTTSHQLGHSSSNLNYYHHQMIQSQQRLPLTAAAMAKQAHLRNSPTNIYANSGITWSQGAIHTLYYFMRCAQLEHVDDNGNVPSQHSHRESDTTQSSNQKELTGLETDNKVDSLDRSTRSDASCSNGKQATQELVYERPYLVLPPLIEWVRVANSHAEYRRSSVVDKDDVQQAARLLLPGVDCPFRLLAGQISSNEDWLLRREMDRNDCLRRLQVDMAFRMLNCGREDLLPCALSLLPSNSSLNTFNEQGLTPLMMAAIRADEAMIEILLNAGADLDAETPALNVNTYCMSVNPETQYWTALNYATIHGQLHIVKMLLERGASVEGGARHADGRVTESPLQLAAAAGNLDMVKLLLAYGARPFLSTTASIDALPAICGSKSSYGCYTAIAVAASHGQRAVLRALLTHGDDRNKKETLLSLEEILAEGASSIGRKPNLNKFMAAAQPQLTASVSELNPAAREYAPAVEAEAQGSKQNHQQQMVHFNKSQLRALQEAMYHSAEGGHLEITLDFRNIGVPWTLHTWMQSLATAFEMKLDTIMDQLLQDFLHLWPDDCSVQFVEECLPLLFNIFRHSKNSEGTMLLLADLFSSCFGKEPLQCSADNVPFHGGARIDPKYVNNPELSDIQFRVDGRIFYAHKIILVNASQRFQQLVAAKSSDGKSVPIVQINDIRFPIFELVMKFLYNGGCDEFFEIDQTEVLELMAAANYFQLDGLLNFCQSRCARLMTLDNVVSLYIHAKVYSAVHLLEFSQCFILQNFVALLTYDDAVRKLIFGKRLHNHDVLSGLLFSLQARIRERASTAASVVLPRNHHHFLLRAAKAASNHHLPSSSVNGGHSQAICEPEKF